MDFDLLDWSLLQSFIAVAEHGSLSAAAREINGSQPTMSRHISQLEEEIGARLFDRSKSGVVLTARGEELKHHVEKMAVAAATVSLRGENQSEGGLSGVVRITASNIVASYVLPEILAEFHVSEPDIQIEVEASDETRNLLRREADIAVRMYRPTQMDVISRKIGEFEIGAYAARSYIERKGEPKDFCQIHDHDFVGYDRSTLIIDGFRTFGLTVDRDFFKFRSDDQVVCWQMVLAGFGIGFNQTRIGDADARVQRLSFSDSVGTMPVWLTAHKDLKKSARVRRVYDFLADKLKELMV